MHHHIGDAAADDRPAPDPISEIAVERLVGGDQLEPRFDAERVGDEPGDVNIHANGFSTELGRVRREIFIGGEGHEALVD